MGLAVQRAGIDLEANPFQHDHNLITDGTALSLIFGSEEAQHNIFAGPGAIRREVAHAITISICEP